MRSEEAARKWCQGIGVEIGAFKSPIPGITPIYVDKFKEYANEPTNAVYYGDACELPFENSSLDYVATSHVLEHTANPVKALVEWHRVLKPGGIAYMVVPDKHHTFDSPRETTSPNHMLEDYLADVDDTDPTHIDDFVYGVDWAEFSPSDPPEEWEKKKNELAAAYRKATAENNIINIHFHVFTRESLLGLVERTNEDSRIPFRWSIETSETRFPEETPNGILLVLRKPGSPSLIDSIKRSFAKFRSSNYPILENARRFE